MVRLTPVEGLKCELFLQHNEFLPETRLLINGEDKTGSLDRVLLQKPLCEWIDSILAEFMSDEDMGAVKVSFRGTDLDYSQVVTAVERLQKQYGCRIFLGAFHRLASAEDLLNIFDVLACDLVHAAGPLFPAAEFYEAWSEALDRDFHVTLLPLDGANASPLMNSLLGNNLLPASINVPVTVSDHDGLAGFIGAALAEKGDVISRSPWVFPADLTVWQENPLIDRIALKGDVPGVQESLYSRLVLTAMPIGPSVKSGVALSLTAGRSSMVACILSQKNLLNGEYDEALMHVRQEIERVGREHFLFVVSVNHDLVDRMDAVFARLSDASLASVPVVSIWQDGEKSGGSGGEGVPWIASGGFASVEQVAMHYMHHYGYRSKVRDTKECLQRYLLQAYHLGLPVMRNDGWPMESGIF